MVRLILILVLLFYVLYKFGFFRVLQESMKGDDDHRRRSDKNVNVDSDSNHKKKSFKGGEYVDYEDVNE